MLKWKVNLLTKSLLAKGRLSANILHVQRRVQDNLKYLSYET